MLKFVIFVVILRASQKITLTQCYFKWNHPYGCQTDKFARVRLCTLVTAVDSLAWNLPVTGKQIPVSRYWYTDPSRGVAQGKDMAATSC